MSTNLQKPTRFPLIGWFGAVVLVVGVTSFGFLVWQPMPDLDTRLDQARKLLIEARSTGAIHRDARFTALALPQLDDAKARKLLFIAKMLPHIVAENQRILGQRASIENAPSPAQLNALGIAYGLKPGAVKQKILLARIDALPVSLVLAQAALESGWGLSRFARQGHAYFGERTFDPDAPGMAPKRATGFKVKSFINPALSVRSYMRTLNSHRAYHALRTRRATLRALGRAPSGADLAQYLESYSELGEGYVTRILSTIEINHLSDFDGVKYLSANP